MDKVLPKEDQRRWTSRSIGSNLQHNVFYSLIRFGGRRASYALLHIVTFYYVLFRPAIRKKAEYYLQRRFKTRKVLDRFSNCRRLYMKLGEALVDRAIVGIRGSEQISIAFKDMDTLLNLVSEGKGVILLTSHVGCWQAAMSRLQQLNTPVSLLLHREAGDVDLHYFEHTDGPRPFRIIDPLGYMGGVLEMMEVLKKGEIVSIMGDRVLGGAKSVVSVPFLGGKATFPFSAFKLASATGAPLAVLFSYKSGPASYELFVDKVIRVPGQLGKSAKAFSGYVAQFVEALERYVARYPYQFFNFFDMWEEDQTTTLNK